MSGVWGRSKTTVLIRCAPYVWSLLFWVFWSAVLGATFVPSAIVSRRRRARGQCLKCGYAMAEGGLDRCPECGQ